MCSVFAAACTFGQATVIGPTTDTVCPSVSTKVMSFRVASNKATVTTVDVSVNVTSGLGVSCTVAPANGKAPVWEDLA